MKTTVAVILALLSFGASAQGTFGGFDQGDVCYSWEGGHKSAGSFSRCQPNIRITVQAPAALPPPVQPSPVLMPMSAPQTCAPPPKATKHIVRKKKPPVKC